VRKEKTYLVYGEWSYFCFLDLLILDHEHDVLVDVFVFIRQFIDCSQGYQDVASQTHVVILVFDHHILHTFCCLGIFQVFPV